MYTALALILGLAGPPVGSLREPLIVPIEEISETGDCIKNGKSFNLERVLFLENKTLELDEHGRSLRVRLSGENVTIEDLGSRSEGKFFANIGYEVDKGGDLDVLLKLAQLNGQLVLYWRETSLHRVYRQGLFRIGGKGISPMCEGTGGISSSH